MQFYLLITLASYVIFTCTATVPDNSEQVLEQTIFGNNGRLLKPTETRDLLVGLKDRHLNSDQQTFSLTIERAVKLAEFSYINASKCKWSYLFQFKSTIEANSKHYLNLVPYLKHYLIEQIQACNTSFYKMLKDNVETLTVDEKQSLRQLKNYIAKGTSIKKDETGYLHFPLSSFKEGARSYIGQVLNVDPKAAFKGKQGHKLYKQEYKHLISDLCESVYQKLKSSLEIYDLFFKDPKIAFETTDEFTSLWLENVEMCSVLAPGKKGSSKNLTG